SSTAGQHGCQPPLSPASYSPAGSSGCSPPAASAGASPASSAGAASAGAASAGAPSASAASPAGAAAAFFSSSAASSLAICAGSAAKLAAAPANDAFIAPASLASSTSRGSRSASLEISSGVRVLPSSTPPLITSSGFAFEKSRSPLAACTTSPPTNAIADGPTSSCEKSAVIPASLAAIFVRVFLTTENDASWPSASRSALTWATVSPRYSVSTAPDEF